MLACGHNRDTVPLIELTYWLQWPFHLEKNHDERIKRTALIRGAQAPHRQKPSIKKKTHGERIKRTTQKWSAQATHRQTSMIWNSVAARKESQQKWCYSLLWRDDVEDICTKIVIQDVLTSVITTASIMFTFSSLVVCTFTNKQKIVVCYFSVMITIQAMASMALFTVITTTCKNYKLSCLKMTSL